MVYGEQDVWIIPVHVTVYPVILTAVVWFFTVVYPPNNQCAHTNQTKCICVIDAVLLTWLIRRGSSLKDVLQLKTDGGNKPGKVIVKIVRDITRLVFEK